MLVMGRPLVVSGIVSAPSSPSYSEMLSVPLLLVVKMYCA